MLSFKSPDEAARWVSLLEELEPDKLADDTSPQSYVRQDVLERLLAESESAIRDNPERAERLGLIAVVLSGRLDQGEGWVPTGLARACTAIGAARRAQGKRKQADVSLESTSSLLASGIEEGAYCRELALLRWEQGRGCEATALLQLAVKRFGEASLAARESECLGLLGILTAEENRPYEALVLLLQAAESLAADDHPRLDLAVRLHLAHCQAMVGTASEALKALRAARRSAAEAGGDPETARTLDWMEGRTLRQLGDRTRAEMLLSRAQEALLESGELGEATLVTLEMALLAAERGELEDLPTLVDEIAAQFRGVPGLPLALQALCAFEEEALIPGGDLEVAVAAASRFLRQTLRSQGFRVQPPPYP